MKKNEARTKQGDTQDFSVSCGLYDRGASATDFDYGWQTIS